MATLPTVEDNAQKVLEVFSHFRARPGRVLHANNFVAIGARRRWDMSDLQQGLEFASSFGWIRERNNGIELTQEGFAKMPEDFAAR